RGRGRRKSAGACRFLRRRRGRVAWFHAIHAAMELEDFLRPLYQDLDGVTRFDAVERVGRIARQLYTPASDIEARAFELLLLFHGLRRWLEKMGNVSRTTLAAGVTA